MSGLGGGVKGCPIVQVPSASAGPAMLDKELNQGRDLQLVMRQAGLTTQCDLQGSQEGG